MEFFREFSNLNIFEQIAGISMSALFLLCVGLKGLLAISYRIAISDVVAKGKGIKDKGDIEKLGMGALRRTSREYVLLAGAGAKVDALALAAGSVYKNPVWVFNFGSLTGFCAHLERAFLPLSVLFVLAVSYPMEFAVVFAGMYLFMRLFALIFDVDTVKERYVRTLADVLQVQVGRHFPADTAGSVNTLSNDLNVYLQRQSAMFNDIMEKINTNLSDAIKTNVTAMTAGVAATMDALTREVGSQNLEARNESLEGALAVARENQDALRVSVAEYEASLKGITGQIGDAFGAIVTHNLQAANMVISDRVNENLESARALNAEHLNEIKSVFAELSQQNKIQTQLLVQLVRGSENE
ncbi:MAG: hypothetical protein FWB74_05410 [Defluviitaleaceae bacterium]|nr:hypothetical protein [Defluviitaleaceae bacterium]